MDFTPIKKMTIGEVLENYAGKIPDKQAVVFGEQSLTNRELNEALNNSEASMVITAGEFNGVNLMDMYSQLKPVVHHYGLVVNASMTAEQLECDEQDRFLIVVSVVFLDSLPMTASGKIKKMDLRELLLKEVPASA